MEGFLAVYFSIRKPTEDERQGARPPAVRIATFAYGMHSLGSFRARGGVGYRVCGRCAARPRRRRGRAAMAQIWARICRPSAVNGMAACAARPTRSRLPAARERATGPGERFHWCAAVSQTEDFYVLWFCSSAVANIITREQMSRCAASRGVQWLLTCFGAL
mgnify:CR=1 FL=1